MSAHYVLPNVENKLTQENQDSLCFIIGDWYCIWKWSLWEGDKSHLDGAIFMLKNFIKWQHTYFPDSKLSLDTESLEMIFSKIDLWVKVFPPVRTGERSHNFGHAKEILKAVLCGDSGGDI